MLEVDTNRCMHVEQNREREREAFGETECDAYEKRANLIRSSGLGTKSGLSIRFFNFLIKVVAVVENSVQNK